MKQQNKEIQETMKQQNSTVANFATVQINQKFNTKKMLEIKGTEILKIKIINYGNQ